MHLDLSSTCQYKQINKFSGLNTRIILFFFTTSILCCASRRKIILYPATSTMMKELISLLTTYSLPTQCGMTKCIASFLISIASELLKKTAYLMLKHPLHLFHPS